MRGLVKKAFLGTVGALIGASFLLLPFIPAGAGPISVESGGAPRLPKLQLEPIATASLPACGASTEGIAYYDTTANALSVCNASANVSVAGAGACTNQFVRATVAGAAPTCAAVSLTADVSGILPVANGGTNGSGSADDAVLVGNGTTWESKTVPNCTDTGGNHLNYTQSSNTWSCGTTDTGVSDGFAFARCVTGASCENTNFLGTWNNTSTLTVANVSCNWGTTGVGGTTGVVVQVYNLTNSSEVCSCTLGACTTAASSVLTCTCSGSMLAGRNHALRLTTATDCDTNPNEIHCNINYQ